jgi:site-specific recombinase XerD
MLEDMAMRGLRSDTQHDYVRVVRSFAAFLGQPPDTATAEDIRRFQVHQRESGVHARVATKTIRSVTSPLEHLALLMQGEAPSG